MKLSFLPAPPARTSDTPSTLPPSGRGMPFPWSAALCMDIVLSIAGLLGGWLLSRASLPADTAAELLAAHLPQEGLHPLLFWLRVALSLLPGWLLFGLAGLCCCGGGLCGITVLLRSLCEGAALGVLSLCRMSVPTVWARVAVCFLLRLFLSLHCRATAATVADPTMQHLPGQRGLSPLMRRHLTGWLGVGAAGAVTVGLYTWVSYILYC